MLSYEESLQRLECDLAKNLKNNGFTMAGYMDIENLQKCLEENINLKMQIDELEKWTEERLNKPTKVTILEREFDIGERYAYEEFLSKLKEVKK